MSHRLTFNYSGKNCKKVTFAEPDSSAKDFLTRFPGFGYINIREYEDSVKLMMNDVFPVMLGYSDSDELLADKGLLRIDDDSIAVMNGINDRLGSPMSYVFTPITFFGKDNAAVTLKCMILVEGDTSVTFLTGGEDEARTRLFLEMRRTRFFQARYHYFVSLTEDMPSGIAQFEARPPFNILSSPKRGSGYNLMFQSYFGYPEVDGLDARAKTDFMSLVHPDDRVGFQNAARKTLAGENMRCEFRIFCYDNTMKRLSGTFKCAATYDGTPILQFVGLDTTELYQAQCELLLQNETIRQNEASISAMRDSLQSIMTNLPAGICVYEVKDGVPELKYISDRVYTTYGYPVGSKKLPEDISFENIVGHHGCDDGDDGVFEFITPTRNRRNEILHVRYIIKRAQITPSFVCYYVTMMDITERVLADQAQEKQNALYKMLLNDSDELLFEYDATTDTMECSYRAENGQRANRIYEKFIRTVSGGGFGLNAETGAAMAVTINNALKNGSDGTFEYLADRYGNGGMMYRAYYKAVRSGDKASRLVVGRAVNIQSEFDSIGSLKKQASLDLLSMTDNRISGEREIREYIAAAQPGEKFAFWIFDIDNFKRFNDDFGHPTGDQIIRAVASTLNELASGQSSVVARFGGDEFVLFERYSDIAELNKKAADIMAHSHKVAKKIGLSVSLSLSIGVSVFPEDANEFDGLFRKADIALYNSKKCGKDRMTLYSEIR